MPQKNKFPLQFLLFHLVIPIGFFLLARYFMPIATVFQFDSNDEGIELIKAMSYRSGFELYTQIYNDQPPLFTIILAAWMQVFGQSIVAVRLLTLSFATLLVWAFAQVLRFYLGNLPALIGTVWLIVSCNFLRLSVSVMVGLPALTMAMLSIYALTFYKQNSSRLPLVISGIFLALSLQIKLFTFLLIPLLIFEIIQFRWQRSRVFDALIWLTSLITVFLSVGLYYHSLSYQQLVASHFDSGVKVAFDAMGSYQVVAGFLVQDIDYFLLAIPAVITVWKTKQWQHVLPIGWLIAAFILLLQHRPVWYHHYLLVSIPLAWLAAIAFSTLGTKGRWVKGCVILSLLLIPVKLGITQLENNRVLAQNPDRVQLVQALMPSDQASTSWIFTDCPIYAFYADLKVPPEIAVLSFIRIESQAVTAAQMLAVFEQYQPQQALLCKSPTVRNYVQDYLNQHYTQTYTNKVGQVYRRRLGLVEPPH
jgi:4-amino-4-deoxy-L-arabinose transferase-like glycosyltransferase